jgi:patatin-like phospholipase/acyl hydrolase
MKVIISIDGGGIRGIVTAAILDYIERKIQEIQGDNRIRIGNLVDLVAGTSTGSIVGALMLIPSETSPWAKYTMKEIIDLYFSLGETVFKSDTKHNFKTLWGLIGPQFSASNIEDPLLTQFNHYKLKDLIKPCLFTGYDIDKRIVNIYTNSDIDRKYAEYYVKDIVRGSTAIPSIFPPAYFKEGIDINTIVDGGVFAGNPSMIAYIEAFKTLFGKADNVANLDPNQVLMISLGTGIGVRTPYSFNTVKRWGKAQWLMPVLNVLMSAATDITDYEMSMMFKSVLRNDNYKRINPPLTHNVQPSTDASKENMLNLLKDANDYIEANKAYLDLIAHEICDLHYLIKLDD